MCMCTTRLSGVHSPPVSRFRLVCAKVPCQLGRERSRFSPVAVAYGLVFAGHHGPWLPVIQSRVVHGGPGFCCPALCGHESLLQACVGTSRSLQGRISLACSVGAVNDHIVGDSPGARMQPPVPRARLSVSWSTCHRVTRSRTAGRRPGYFSPGLDTSADWEGAREWILRHECRSAGLPCHRMPIDTV